MTRYRLLDCGPLSAARNMALDEVLTRRNGQGLSLPTLRFLQFEPDAALVGYNQQVARELRLDFCREHGIEVNRRVSGGGALLFQSSALGWELIAPQGTPPFQGDYGAQVVRICEAAAKGLSRLGFDARFRPRNDIEVDGRKISGTGGTVIEGGVMFQGTVLVRNEIDRFLRALRVPVEKLKKREIESLMQRLAFVEELIHGPLDMNRLKACLAETLAQELDLELYEDGLSADEGADLEARLPYFKSEEWLRLREPDSGKPAWLKEILQTPAGTIWVNLWLDVRGRLIQKALFNGDFFTSPQRLVMDLEAHLMGKKADPEVLKKEVLDFLARAQGELVGIEPSELAEAVSRAAERRALMRRFDPSEAAEMFLVGLAAEEVGRLKTGWLLLPYCVKPLDCEYRKIPDCAQCGDCQFQPLYDLAAELGMQAVSIQSFEHLMETLKIIRAKGGAFVGSCCEAFFTKHQAEIQDSGAQGVLINLDSTTCYDLGKGMDAYAGKFDHQTELNLHLFKKAARVMAAA